ncbi:peptide chain release factor N(5)-glutamine methyltransferase [Novosphingobium sp.]|uniref:peptide chain release factor N(5)-glutamine methyltransferase n=1 Tax=Novosphingobium sp. TaxID=1874826 RepID=UPI00286E8BDB|nr:peptide chain release factor N(5)-glutamine methyltransferase [Novosphingobium sp.]
MSVGLAIREAAEALEGKSDTARLDAELLMAHLLGVTRSDLLMRHMGDEVSEGYARLIMRRMRGEPVAYIIGTQDFYGHTLRVTPDVLIPRGDSEALVVAALAARPDARRVLDCGTGSGALLLAVLADLPGAEGVGIDSSPAALAVAQGNAETLGLAGRVTMILADWHQPGWAEELGQFDLILANPPYVEEAAELDASVRDHEPASALFSGPEGLDDYRVLVPQLSGLLVPGGAALVEIGYQQAEPVGTIAQAAGLSVTLHRDLAGRPRVLEMVHCETISLGNAGAAA